MIAAHYEIVQMKGHYVQRILALNIHFWRGIGLVALMGVSATGSRQVDHTLIPISGLLTFMGVERGQVFKRRYSIRRLL